MINPNTQVEVTESEECKGMGRAFAVSLNVSEDLYPVKVEGTAEDVFKANYTVTMSNDDVLVYTYSGSTFAGREVTEFTINGKSIDHDWDVPQDDARRLYIMYLAKML